MTQERLLAEGDRCGPFTVEKAIGHGGYGEVYSAIADKDGERIALKVVRLQHAADKRAATRQVLETKVIRAIDHPNVVGYRDAGMEGDKVWLAMELLEGHTLSEILFERTTLTVHEVCDIARQTCLGLQAAHDVGAVHRDIKPSNLFITDDNVVKLIDFGIAKHKRVNLGTTVAVGTPLYMAPDYLRLGPSAEGDPRWDLYALSLMLWQCAAGRHPHAPPGEELSLGTIIHKIMTEKVPPLTSIDPTIPQRFSDAIAKGVVKEPEKRWQTATELAAEMEAILVDMSGSNEPTKKMQTGIKTQAGTVRMSQPDEVQAYLRAKGVAVRMEHPTELREYLAKKGDGGAQDNTADRAAEPTPSPSDAYQPTMPMTEEAVAVQLALSERASQVPASQPRSGIQPIQHLPAPDARASQVSFPGQAQLVAQPPRPGIGMREVLLVLMGAVIATVILLAVLW